MEGEVYSNFTVEETRRLKEEPFPQGEHDSSCRFIDIEELADVISPFSEKQRTMALLAAYLDESGTHRESPVLVVAGYLAPVSEWKKFQRRWANVLRCTGLDDFHMTDFENRIKAFADWSGKKRISFIKNLLKAVTDHVSIGVAAAVVVSDYLEVFADSEEKTSPYTFCLLRCFDQVRRWAARTHMTNLIAYVVEDGAGFVGEVQYRERLLKELPDLRARYRFSSLTFASKREFSQLQAADIFAYEYWKECVNRAYDGEKRPRRKSMDNLLSSRHVLDEYFDREGLLRLKNNLA